MNEWMDVRNHHPSIITSIGLQKDLCFLLEEDDDDDGDRHGIVKLLSVVDAASLIVVVECRTFTSASKEGSL